MAKTPAPQPEPKRRRRRRRRTWKDKLRAWTKDWRPVLIGVAVFGLFLKASVNRFDKDEWVELGVMASTLYGVVRAIKEISDS